MRTGNYIKKLIVWTVIILAAIVALQFYWLFTSYRQQQAQFKMNINNALSDVTTKILLQKISEAQENRLLGNTVQNRQPIDNMSEQKDHVTQAEEQKPGKKPLSVISVTDSNQDKKVMVFFDSNGNNTITNSRTVRVSLSISDTDLVNYKVAYKKELQKRNIKISVDLALADSTGQIYGATCDTAVFRQYSGKSSLNEIPGSIQEIGLVAGFKNPNLYILREMFWVLLITLGLIILGGSSLAYVLINFFNQKRIAEIRNDFMNNMTHELKTPISSISLVLEMVLEENVPITPEKKNMFLLSAQKEVNRLKLIVENVLKILSLENSEIVLIKSAFFLSPLLNSIIERLNPLLEEKKVSISVNIKPDSLTLYADEVHISNLIYNLMENAIKYNNKTDALIRITAEATQGNFEFRIWDNGEGIQEQYADKIFEKFFRVPKGNIHNIKGYGLGLSYVKSIVEMHEGTITANSSFGEMTEFIIRLPVNEV